MNTDELLEYYANLLIMQYRNKPKAKETIKLLVEALFLGNIALAVEKAYSIDTALGVQLDIIGKYIGFSRVLTTVSTEIFRYYMDDPSQPSLAGGYAGYNDLVTPLPYANFVNYGIAEVKLTDKEYRNILMFLIFCKGGDLSLQDVDNALYNIYGTNVTVTEGDKSVLYSVSENVYSGVNLVYFVEKYFPRPMGCTISSEQK